MPEENQEQRINYRTPEWRKAQQERLKEVVQEEYEAVIARFSGESMFKYQIGEWYTPHIEESYWAWCEAKSKAVPVFGVHWNPLKREFARSKILVAEKGQGVGTALNEAVERMARKLGAKKLVFQAVFETSLDYWKSQPGVVMERSNAVKHLD